MGDNRVYFFGFKSIYSLLETCSCKQIGANQLKSFLVAVGKALNRCLIDSKKKKSNHTYSV